MPRIRSAREDGEVARRVLVTGGAGFIGSHVADRFLEQGAEVEILDDLSTGRRENVPAGAVFHQLDIRTSDAARLVREGRYDVMVHLAAQMDVRRSVEDPAFDASVNVVGTINLMEALRAAGRPARVVFSSTGGALYGDFVQPPSAESFAKDPDSPYGVAKLSVEYYLAYYGRVHGLETAALRFANVYGPRQNPHGEAGVVAIFCSRLLAGQPLTVFGDGCQTRDYVNVSDVSRACLLAATRPLPAAGRLDERAFNVGTGVETSVLTLAQELAAAAGRAPDIQHRPARAGELLRSAVDASKTTRVLGWRAEVGLAEGLADTYRWFASRLPSHSA